MGGASHRNGRCRSRVMMTKQNLGRWLLVGFLSGAVSVLVGHQVVAALLHAIGMTPRAPYSMQPTQPLGIPQLWSIVFWGGVWGLVLAAALRRYTGGALVIAATIFGAILPSLVAWTVVDPERAAALCRRSPERIDGRAARQCGVGPRDRRWTCAFRPQPIENGRRLTL